VPKRHICPNGCNANFTTVAHIMQEWEVDTEGEFVKVTEECLQVSYPPRDDNIWTCVKCGAEGKIQES